MRQGEEKLEYLQCAGLKIWQSSQLYTFTSDSVILANVILIRRNETAVEIGMGSGVISILASVKTNAKQIIGFEMQPQMAQLALRNISLNHLESKISVIEDRVQHFKQYIAQESIDVVFSNPPYMQETNTREKDVRYLSRHDDALKIDELCDCASKLLKFGGRFYVVYAASRVCELIVALSKVKLQPKQMFFTENGKHKIILVVIEAVKGGGYGVKVHPNLVTNDADGKYLEALHTRYFIKN